METLIWLKRIRVENANCIHGMTWGFPGYDQFLRVYPCPESPAGTRL